ncbi:hypothetical protein [Terriglobus roseus]|uniref:Type II secretory pathway, pseudopilin PulG n=1 Tax=Terriglobus roseus TaxID=392734 RepID=A0A1G7M8F0_9BACT|nr:hypothetical protein [Terriglobus roseus]SDF57991.1 hypothetical protein SAMN05444167_2735 [Terriglobus roseus]
MTTLKPVRKHSEGEEGYLLLGLVVVCFLLLLVLGVAAPRVAKELERDREVESEHRAQEYVRAIQLFYKKNSRYPTSMDELLGKGPGGGMSLGGTSTNAHYLRQEYKDPITGGEYRLIHFGEAKTEVKGFFGEPLQGMPAGNLGSAAGMVSNLGGNSGTGTTPGSPTATGGLGTSTSPTGTTGTTGSTTGSTGTSTGSTTGTGTGSQTDVTSTLGGNNASSFQGSKGAIVGVGSNGKGHGLVEWNGSENIEDWEFLYDPRVEQLKARVSIFGGTPAANGNGSFGSFGNGVGTTPGTTTPGSSPGTDPNSSSGTPSTSTPTTGTSGTTPQ